MGEIVKKVYQQYMLQLQLHPLRTKMITSGVLSAISDSTAQKLSGINKLQFRRLLLKILFGVAYGGPFGHIAHNVLDSIFKGKRDKRTVVKKVFLEQLTVSPIRSLLFLFYNGFVVERRGRTLSEVISRVKKQYPSVQLAAWMFWPIVGWINHLYMPLHLRVIFQSCVACCWGIFLNLKARIVTLKNQ